jgi:Fur family zinc uptake transcriptional regulator
MSIKSNKTQKNKRQCLDFAAQIAESKGQRWTDMREAVFSCIIDQEKPVTAYQLIDQISQKQNKDIKPASIYRSLDALNQLGLVVKIESLNAFIACSHLDHHHEHVFLICRQCGSADELADHSVSKKLGADASNQGFKIERLILELQGACRDCQT